MIQSGINQILNTYSGFKMYQKTQEKQAEAAERAKGHEQRSVEIHQSSLKTQKLQQKQLRLQNRQLSMDVKIKKQAMLDAANQADSMRQSLDERNANFENIRSNKGGV